MGVVNNLARLSLLLISALLSGCLAGERPPLSTLYPDPISQAPVVSGQAPMVSGSATRVERYEFYGPPGTTFSYGETPIEPPLGAGQSRYIYFGDTVRCDNLDRFCARWSRRQGMFVPDAAATRRVYGGAALGPGYPYRQY